VAGFDSASTLLQPAHDPAGPPEFAGGLVGRFLSEEAKAALVRLRDRCRATDAIVLLAAYYVLLHRHGAAADQVVGVMANTRRAARTGDVGYHVSTLPLRLRIDPDAGFAAVVADATSALIDGLRHSDVPFEMVAGEVGDAADVDWWRSRLVRHLFNFRQSAAAAPAAPELARRESTPSNGAVPTEPNWRGLTDVHTGLARFDLELTAEWVTGDLSVRLGYRDERYDRGFVFDLLGRLDALLVAAGADDGLAVAELDLTAPRDRALLAEANDTATRLPGPATVLAAFAERAAAVPDAVAVIDDGLPTTYRQLARAATMVRDRIVAELGDANGAVVALAGPRGAGLAAAALGVWAAGAAYLPLDPDHPADRLGFELDDADCRLIIDGDRLPAACRNGRTCLSTEPPAATVGTGPSFVDESGPDDVAYVIYTSGSTGRPKGVRLSHANLANVVGHFAAGLDVTAGTGMIWLTTFAFDISALELWLPLTRGGRVVTAPDEARTDPARLLALATAHDVAVLQATPTTWRLVARDACATGLAGRTVLCGGEPLSPALARELLATGCRLINVYGPTETTIWSTSAELVDDAITVGTPIANTVAAVLDERGNPLPPGLTGELCLAGAGVAIDYLDRPELTGDRFRTDPRFGRYYRTGDLARWRRDGRLELVGRADRQIKLRAHRIELGEVENAFEDHAEVAAAAVLPVGQLDGDGFLAAFVVAAQRPGLADDLWRHAARVLPAYAVPARIIAVDALPQTANGKVDLGALALRLADVHGAVPAERAVPDGPVGELLALWRELLGRDGLDEQANFFLNGGSSLQAVRLAERAGAVLGTKLTLGMVFRAPTPVALAALAAEPGRQS
jgi:amino acid adenylation domain-containing protein